jgi:hypothetical protein
MFYVYILRSLQQADRFYVGVIADLRACLCKHNACEVQHTSKYSPWTVKTYIAFSSEKQAFCIPEISQVAVRPSFCEETSLIGAGRLPKLIASH